MADLRLMVAGFFPAHRTAGVGPAPGTDHTGPQAGPVRICKPPPCFTASFVVSGPAPCPAAPVASSVSRFAPDEHLARFDLAQGPRSGPGLESSQHWMIR